MENSNINVCGRIGLVKLQKITSLDDKKYEKREMWFNMECCFFIISFYTLFLMKVLF